MSGIQPKITKPVEAEICVIPITKGKKIKTETDLEMGKVINYHTKTLK